MAYITTQTHYMKHAFFDTESILDQARRWLSTVEYDTLVGTGMSGALVIPLIARTLKKRWLVVRKTGVETHSRMLAEGTLGERWVFVDDCIDSGSTYDRVREVVGTLCSQQDHEAALVGAYLYNHGGEWRTPSGRFVSRVEEMGRDHDAALAEPTVDWFGVGSYT